MEKYIFILYMVHRTVAFIHSSTRAHAHTHTHWMINSSEFILICEGKHTQTMIESCARKLAI